MEPESTTVSWLEKVKEVFIEDLTELRFEARIGLETRWNEEQRAKHGEERKP